MPITLSDLALKDLEEIRHYTVRQWGREQWLRYYRGLVSTFERIEQSPESGRSRDLFLPGLRSISYGKHSVFYAPIAAAGGAIVILRIVHQKRHLPALTYYEDIE
ncbi:type II toxin-antitoxin system RelE/ParE family toxin [Rhodospirillum rubrum]|uniref:Plasmid stabilization system n=1 Tax=Rhodospirillum rubrum (strain ATCC 11170 / ATH 1.1.1 / DSM 467 / LMG 4362 / NCIMB 8255 / S1) TaxID=269796 RepID=Q2RWJ2_RHORT|nr:type II toxin-antitoxin system RelE/ParE family toxin [Rhodospirillum rubrum]ABC21503.1 Plasmid stabilization system [Rhodospirillum rubrum ATCC 11170]AEO47187.1 plasmid stabilization system protein [Rhodospirillum rubrum F11]MBK5953100.1 RelE/ParE family toxin [Rhodospirillum rubrum]QXG81177.1 type II toxin-antitoxin system RelE/ParE family toxin [Rhodospirillum rubrum]HAQ01480.1 type II toxin-antitoxin system RelE/ParE family toxin [Rhodospirillum rubrum]